MSWRDVMRGDSGQTPYAHNSHNSQNPETGRSQGNSANTANIATKGAGRPETVRCIDCQHFRRTPHPHLGYCAAGEPEAICGLWDTDDRWCQAFTGKD